MITSSAPAAVQVARLDEVAVAEQHRVLLLVSLDVRRHLGQHVRAVVVVGDAAEALRLALRAEVACTKVCSS